MMPNPDLEKFLRTYDDPIQTLTIELCHFVKGLVPEANELIWDNYNAVAIAYSKSQKLKDAFYHIAVYRTHVNFGFNRGAELKSGTIELPGKGKLIRHLSVKNFLSFPESEIAEMIVEAVKLSERLNPYLINVKAAPKSMVVSISEKKIRPSKK